MNPRRSKSLRLVSSNSKPIEVEIHKSSPMGSSVDNTVYCCVAKGAKILYSYNSKDHELEALAALCLENAPPYHTWYFHTVGTRTFGFLMEGGHTYFAIVDPSMGNLGILRFLEHVRDGFRRASKNGFHDELVPIIQRLAASLRRMPQPAIAVSESPEGPSSSDGLVPLLGNCKHEKKNMKDSVVEVNDTSEVLSDRGADIGIPAESVGGGAMCLQKSPSSTRTRSPQMGRRLWWRHVKIVVLIDVVLCLVLFGVWLAVCKGFRCVSR